MKKTGLRIPLLSGLVLLSLCLLPAATAKAANQPEKKSDVFAAFESWAGRFQSTAAADVRSGMASEGLTLARQRHLEMAQLVKSDPGRALALTLPDAARKKLPAEILQELETPISGTGDLTVLGALRRTGGPRVEPILRRVHLNGQTFPAYVYGKRLSQTSKKSVYLQGILVDGAVALSDIVETGADVSGNPTGGNPPSAWTTGLKNVLIIRVDFSDLAGDPVGWNDTSPLGNNNTVYTHDYVQDVADTRISPYYFQSSYGLTTLANTVSVQVYRMPQTAAAYAASQTGNEQLHADAEAAAAADYNLANFDRLVVLFSNLSGFPNSVINYGGLAEVVGKRAWLNGEFDFRVVTHELGHTYGLLHAGLWQVDDADPISPSGSIIEYGDDFDTMGANFANDPRTDFNPYYKNILGWIPDYKVQVAETNGTYRLYAFDTANYIEATNNPILAIKFVKDTQRTYWIGARRNFANNELMHDGAYIIWGFDSVGGGSGGGFQSGLLDMTTPGTAPGANVADDYDAALGVKTKFSDPSLNLTIMPVGGDNSVLNGYLDVQFGEGSALTVLTNFITGGNGNGIIDFNECNNLQIVLTNAGLAASNITVTVSTVTSNTIVAQGFSPYPDIPDHGTGINVIPFKISTAPDFVCGTPVDLQLVIRTDLETRTNFLRLPSGSLDLPIRYDNNTAVAIPDADPNGAVSPMIVTNFNAVVGDLSVALHITHAFTFDLQLELIAPDGTSVILSQNHGGGGGNYGVNCSPDFSRTIFDDSAPFPISGANAPFVGEFQPDQPLSTFNLKSGTNVNGIWKLKVVDNIPFVTGTIECWSLFLTPQLCHDGGGECPGSDLAVSILDSPDPVVIGSNLTYTITVTNSGPSTAKGVLLSQALPPGAMFVSTVVSQGNSQQSGGTVTCNFGIVGARSSATATVVVKPTIEGTTSSTATVASNQPDPNSANNSATAITRVVPPSADLSVTVSDSPDPIFAGGALTYTISVTNRGPSAATGVQLTNTLPSTAVLVSAVASQGTTINAGGTIINHLGALPSGGGAVVTIVVRPSVVGTITETSRVVANEADLFPANNFASATTTVSPAANLALSLVDSPDPVVTDSNITYVITITNSGPNAATGVVVNGTLPPTATFVTNTISQGSFLLNGSSFIASLNSMAAESSAVITVSMAAPSTPQTIGFSATVLASQADPNSTNNSASVTTLVARPFVSIVQAGSMLTSESFAPANGSVDSDETVSVVLRLRNAGNISTTNLVATLLSGGGVTSLSAPQTYGALAPDGVAASKTFSFTANGGSGEIITATLQLQDGATALTNVAFTFQLPTLTTFANTNFITIPDNGPASPYPSQITVSNVTGLVGNVSVTLDKINHTFPDDVDVLLVDPSGRKVLLMADAGGGNQLAGVSLTFDATASSAVADNDQLVSGSFVPADYAPEDFFTNAPAGPYETSLDLFDGTTPNGTWSLYVVDDSVGDEGNIAGGWSLSFTTLAPVNQIAGLNIEVVDSSSAVLLNGNASYTFTISNNGPDVANNVIVNNPLPPNCTAITPTTFDIGTLEVGSSTNVTVTLIPGAVGMLTNTATVSASEIDLNGVNNSASALTAVGLPVSDLGISISAPTNPIVGRDVTYTISVTNSGPDSALAVVVTNRLPTGMNFVSATATQGTCANSAGVVTCALGNVGPNNSVTVSIIATPSTAGLATNSANVVTASNDPNLANNSTSVVSTVANPSAIVVASGSHLISESGLANGVIDPGESVQIAFALANIGTADTANLVATLQASGGVTSSSPQTYGVLVHDGAAVSKTFAFSVAATNNGSVTATLQLKDGANNLGNVNFTFDLPKLGSFVNNAPISIPNSGPATPYPSTITITNATGLVSKVVVTLNGLTHSFPDDLDVLLVSPDGQKVLLMSDVGGAHGISGVNLTFNDSGTALLDAAPIVSGTNSPTDLEPGESLPSAPARPYNSSLTAFNGGNPNGVWKLYINDDNGGDSGNVSGGWSLGLTTVNTINPAANLALSISAPASAASGDPMNYTITVSNQGPATASDVMLTDTLPANFTFNSALPSQGSYVLGAGLVTCNLGSLNSGGIATVTLTGTPTSIGTITNGATATANETDLYLVNNTVQATTSVAIIAPSALGSATVMSDGNFQLTLTGQSGSTYRIDASSDLITWIPVKTNIAAVDGKFQFTDSAATNFNPRFYRAVRLP
jgi:uncharacterized repeat protein (TIGR01451 family)